MSNGSLSLAGNHNPWLIAVIVSIATFMEVLDTSIANVALLHIAGSLAAGPDESTWVLTSYLVSNAVVLPISGWLANVIGRKRFYMGGVALFTISSLLCAMSPSLGWLIFFRVLQGIGGGGLAPSEQSILADTFRPEQRGMAFAMYGVAVVVAPAVGPTVGGWITDNYSWHWLFLINVPVGLVSLTLSHFFLTEPPAETAQRTKLWKRGVKVDYVGFGLVAVALGCLQVVLDKGERDDWFESNFIVLFTTLSGLALLILIPWELTRKDPIVDLRLLCNRGFASACAVMFTMGLILFSTTQLLPQLVQSLMGYDATTAGLILTPGGVAVLFVMPCVGFLLGKLQARTLVAVGLVIEAIAAYHLTGLSLQASYAHLAWARVLQAAGIPFLFVPTTSVAYVGLPPGKSAESSALINLMRNLGGSVGISMVTTLLARRSQFHQSRLAEHLTPYDEPFQRAIQNLPGILNTTTNPVATRQAYAAIYQELQQQAAVIAYLDIFHILVWMAVLMLPLVFLLQKTKLGQTPAGH